MLNKIIEKLARIIIPEADAQVFLFVALQLDQTEQQSLKKEILIKVKIFIMWLFQFFLCELLWYCDWLQANVFFSR